MDVLMGYSLLLNTLGTGIMDQQKKQSTVIATMAKLCGSGASPVQGPSSANKKAQCSSNDQQQQEKDSSHAHYCNTQIPGTHKMTFTTDIYQGSVIHTVP